MIGTRFPFLNFGCHRTSWLSGAVIFRHARYLKMIMSAKWSKAVIQVHSPVVAESDNEEMPYIRHTLERNEIKRARMHRLTAHVGANF